MDETPEDDPATGELPVVSTDDTGGPPRPPRFKRFRLTLKLLAILLVLYFGILTLVPKIRGSVRSLATVNPILIGTGLALEMVSLYAYSLLTRAALGSASERVSTWRVFRIQMSTKALSSIVPGGSAAGSALGYRLLTLSGVPGPDAGFALATAGLGSAVVLNLIFWGALIVSIPIRGVNPGYATGAVAGIILMGFAGGLVFGLLEGQTRAEKVLRWIARKVKLNEDRTAAAVRHIGTRIEDLVEDRQLLGRVIGWAAANWLLDVAALWLFLRAFGVSVDVDVLLVSYGLVNVLAVIPITPGGLGIIDLGLVSALVGFGIADGYAVLGVTTWRLAQYFFPIILGAALYGTLRFGPWSIERRERLQRLRDIAKVEAGNTESALDFAVRFGRRRVRPEMADGPITSPPVAEVPDDDPALPDGAAEDWGQDR